MRACRFRVSGCLCRGVYGQHAGLTDAACDGVCTQGSWCPIASKSPTAQPCGADFLYCPNNCRSASFSRFVRIALSQLPYHGFSRLLRCWRHENVTHGQAAMRAWFFFATSTNYPVSFCECSFFVDVRSNRSARLVFQYDGPQCVCFLSDRHIRRIPRPVRVLALPAWPRCQLARLD